MPEEISFAIGLLTATAFWVVLKHMLTAYRVTKQRQIARVGIVCSGKIVAIQRPFMLDPYTRLYFDFVPDGMKAPIRACHAVRGSRSRIAIPPQGSTVTVRYLPHQPEHAVIGKLVTE